MTGNFDCVIVSPLRRTIETLYYSEITYKELIINKNFRERIFNIKDRMLLENDMIESDDQFFDRTSLFHNELESLCSKYNSILLIGHAYFINAWYRQGCYPSPPHAEIIELI